MKVLITGAAQGFGRALTDAFLEMGCEVYAVDRRTDALDQVTISSRGACKVFLADMSSIPSLERLLDRIGDARFDAVILNAGVSATGRFEEIPFTASEKLIEVNLMAPLILGSGLVRGGHFVRGGRLVFISSLSHFMGYPGASVYAASKDGIAAYARSVRRPFRHLGVKVMTVFPGPLRTTHAERHAPAGADPNKRTDPRLAAEQLIKALRRGRGEVVIARFGWLTRTFGSLMPDTATRMMRRLIFDKLRKNTY